MTEPTVAHDVIHRLINGIVDQQWHTLGELYADDAVVTHPFAVPEPTRTEGAALRKRFTESAGMPLKLTASNIVIHQTADPEVFVVEYDYHVVGTKTGRELDTANILVMHIRDGKIVSSRDYHNHGVFAAAVTK
ncbi:hypothetical protein F0L68_26060 [Solihabitans fulvus]|uniref:SnoaL-like domain-containing protein n=1 Tax=Solihabitans fulvus TaxID=1892852 RepID=A0A5B2X0M2_9PSEU|nr:nuclear transport factor 2 family protein [Solihabitans fulvus]KAA2256722.1 hypothetical protein F0L68_26060 [Solihabitans fulvus]